MRGTSTVLFFRFLRSQAKREAAAKAQNPAPVQLTLTETVEFHLQTEDRGFTHRAHREQVGRLSAFLYLRIRYLRYGNIFHSIGLPISVWDWIIRSSQLFLFRNHVQRERQESIKEAAARNVRANPMPVQTKPVPVAHSSRELTGNAHRKCGSYLIDCLFSSYHYEYSSSAARVLQK